jgi:N-acetyl-anhydromuramyl-L-alanine amidase AmpD
MPEKITIEFKRKNAHTMKKGRSLNGKAIQIRNIILHSSDGRKAGDLATLTGEKVSADWYVTRAGGIFHLVNDEDTAFHADKVTKPKFFSNAATIGIQQEHSILILRQDDRTMRTGQKRRSRMCRNSWRFFCRDAG